MNWVQAAGCLSRAEEPRVLPACGNGIICLDVSPRWVTAIHPNRTGSQRRHTTGQCYRSRCARKYRV